jgi:hypothetical protein
MRHMSGSEVVMIEMMGKLSVAAVTHNDAGVLEFVRWRAPDKLDELFEWKSPGSEILV